MSDVFSPQTLILFDLLNGYASPIMGHDQEQVIFKDARNDIIIKCEVGMINVLAGLMDIVYRNKTLTEYYIEIIKFNDYSIINLSKFMDHLESYNHSYQRYETTELFYWNYQMAINSLLARSINSVITISLDVETSGQDLIDNGMVELGARSLINNQRYLLGGFNQLIELPETCHWEKACIETFWNSNENLKIKMSKIKNKIGTMPPELVMKGFIKWCKEFILRGCANQQVNRIKFISDNCSFDVSWINYYLSKYAQHYPLHVFYDRYWSAVIDTSSYAFGVSKLSYESVNEIIERNNYFSEDQACRKQLNIPITIKPTTNHDHSAVNDATYIGEEHSIHMLYNIK